MKVIHAKHVWAPLQLALSRSLAKETILTSQSQLPTGHNHRLL